MSCAEETVYHSVFGSETDLSTASIVVVSVILPIQLIILIAIFVKGYSSLKAQKIHISKPNQPSEDNPQQESCCAPTSRSRIVTLIIVTILLFLITLAMLILTSVSVWQALAYTYDYGECVLASSVSSFAVGDSSWIGLDFMTSNTTKLQLDLNTRVKVSQNAIKGLLLNGTVATFPPGIGFPNGTSITNISSETDASQNSVIVTNSVESYIDGALRQWLYRNSSLSGTHPFPICQRGVTALPHPVITNSTIQLNYMDTICQNLTAQVNQLVSNGRSVDNLLIHLGIIESRKTSIDENLTSFNSTMASFSLRSNEYTENLSSVGVDVSVGKALPIVVLCFYVLLFVSTIIYLCCLYRSSYTKRVIVLEESDSEDNSPSQVSKKKRKQKVRPPRLISQYYGKCIMTFYFIVNVFVGLSGLYYSAALLFSSDSCTSFQNAMTSSSAFSSLSLTHEDLLTPVQQCTSGANTFFLQTSQTAVQHNNLQELYTISSLYNQSIPLDVLNSHSFSQTQILKGYLLHMETMPVKSQDFAINSVLSVLNTFTNGSNTASQQLNECGASVLKDQYVYNSVDCSFPLIDYDTEDQTIDPRCIQVPTYDGTSGTSNTDLNKVQHTIVLNGTCPTISDFFDGSNTNCFLGKRLQLLDSAGCTTVSASYAERIKNLVEFSKETGSYTDVYLQNLRNYFGVYAVMNTNLSQFFVGTNMSETLDQFGTLSSNLLNKTSCSYVNSQVQGIFDAYCPTVNSMPSLFFDSFVWVSIGFGLSMIHMGVFYFLDLTARLIFSKRIAKLRKQIQEGIGIESQSKKIQESQQTLREREPDERPVVFGMVRDVNTPPSEDYEDDQVKMQESPKKDSANRFRYKSSNIMRKQRERQAKYLSSEKKERKPQFFEEQSSQRKQNTQLKVVETTPKNQQISRTYQEEISEDQNPFFREEIPGKQSLTKRVYNVNAVSKEGEEDKRIKIIELAETIEKQIGNLDGDEPKKESK